MTTVMCVQLSIDTPTYSFVCSPIRYDLCSLSCTSCHPSPSNSTQLNIAMSIHILPIHGPICLDSYILVPELLETITCLFGSPSLYRHSTLISFTFHLLFEIFTFPIATLYFYKNPVLRYSKIRTVFPHSESRAQSISCSTPLLLFSTLSSSLSNSCTSIIVRL